MKVWSGYGSEHSANLVMIGHFREVRDAERVREVIDRVAAQVGLEGLHSTNDQPPSERRYSDEMSDLLMSLGLYSVGPEELEQFVFDTNISVSGSDVVVRTEESEISAFLKVLINKGARVEVYSAHDYPDGAASSDSEDTSEE